MFDSPSRSSLPPPLTVGSTLVFDSPLRSHPLPFRPTSPPARSLPLISPPCHRTPTALRSPPPPPPPQIVPPIQVILITST